VTATQIPDKFHFKIGEVELQLLLAILHPFLQLRPGALDGEPLFVEELLDLEEGLHLLPLVHTVL